MVLQTNDIGENYYDIQVPTSAKTLNFYTFIGQSCCIMFEERYPIIPKYRFIRNKF